MQELAQELDIPATTLHQWLGKYGQPQSEYESGLQKLRELERQLKEKDQQLADLAEEIAILKQAESSFSKPKR